MGISQTIVLGVFTGILTTALIWLAIRIFNSIIVPWYQEIAYKGIDVSGTWKAKDVVEVEIEKREDDIIEHLHTLTLLQKGHALTGNLSILNKARNFDLSTTSEYIIKGDIADNKIMLSYHRSDRKKVGTGGYLLKVTAQGSGLLGSGLFLAGNDEVNSQNNIYFDRDLS